MNLSNISLEGVSVVSLASLFLQPLVDPEKILPFVKFIKNCGAILCADIRAKDEINIEDYAEILPYIDYIFPNDQEAYFYSKTEEPESAADFFLNMGISNVIVKIGKQGCFTKTAKGEKFITPAFKAEVVDTTGAGDNFAAGFISGILDGKNLEDCCKFASAAANIAIQNVGAFGIIKDKQQIIDVLENSEIEQL